MAALPSAASDYYPDATRAPQRTLDFGAGSETDPWSNQDPWMSGPRQEPWPTDLSGQGVPGYPGDSEWEAYQADGEASAARTSQTFAQGNYS